MNFFGFKQVNDDEKTSLVDKVFQNVAPQYDCMNDIMSFTLHRLWKDWFVKDCIVTDTMRVLDVAGGTGDISLRLLKAFRGTSKSADVILCDPNYAMVKQVNHRAWDSGIVQGLKVVCGRAESLPILDQSIDLYTISFGIRNVTHIAQALQEARRVLKPGGVFRCMEFSNMKGQLLEPLYKKYLSIWLPFLGKTIAQNKEAYQYLGESIRQFPDDDDFKNAILQAGFTKVNSSHYTGHIVTVYNAY